LAVNEQIELLYKVGEILAIVGGAAAILWRVSRAVTRFELIGMQQAEEISEIKASVEKISTVVIDLARQQVRLDAQTERLNMLDKRQDEQMRLYEELRRGVGFITRDQPNH
jgi:hypothetical protein